MTVGERPAQDDVDSRFSDRPGRNDDMLRSRLTRLSLLLAAGLAAGASLASAETVQDMARDLVPAQKPLYELGGLSPEAGADVEAWVDRPERTYAVGQQLKILVRPNRTSYITVLNVGTSGRVAVIFPNFHQRDMQVRAGQTVSIPAGGANWKIDIVGPPGIEVIKVIASKEPLKLPEILKLTGATPEQPLLSLGRSGEEVARDLVPQIANPSGGSVAHPGGVRSLLVRVVQRGASSAFPAPAWSPLTGGFGLTLRPEKAVYRVGEAVRVAVGVERDCHLTLDGVGTSGRAVRLFPNRFQQDGAIRANQTVLVPPPNAPFEIKAQGPAGVEGLLATCRSVPTPSATLAAGGSFAAIGDLASVTRDLAVPPTAADEQIERVSGSFLVTD
jgi:hypothetical protein